MAYGKPKQVADGTWVLPKKAGGYHKSKDGTVVHFKSAAAAQKAGNYVMALEHGFVPTKKRAARYA